MAVALWSVRDLRVEGLTVAKCLRLPCSYRHWYTDVVPFELFYSRFPEIAKAETRSISVLENSRINRLPAADYGFMEAFCDEPGCDCRRVFFSVISSQTKQIEAVIAYGWETKNFYRNWFKYGTDEDIASLQGPELNLSSPQSKHAEGILRLFEEILQNDKSYIERVKRHYKMFRATVDKPRNPLLRRRRTGG